MQPISIFISLSKLIIHWLSLIISSLVRGVRQIPRIIAIIIGLYLALIDTTYTVNWHITDLFYINSILNSLGSVTWLCLILLSIYVIWKGIKSGKLRIISTIMETYTIISFIIIVCNHLVGINLMDWLFVEVSCSVDNKTKMDIFTDTIDSLVTIASAKLSLDQTSILVEALKNTIITNPSVERIIQRAEPSQIPNYAQMVFYETLNTLDSPSTENTPLLVGKKLAIYVGTVLVYFLIVVEHNIISSIYHLIK